MYEFQRITRLPPYVFASVDELKIEARRRGDDIIDFGMGNPDLATPPHIVGKTGGGGDEPQESSLQRFARHHPAEGGHRRVGTVAAMT